MDACATVVVDHILATVRVMVSQVAVLDHLGILHLRSGALLMTWVMCRLRQWLEVMTGLVRVTFDRQADVSLARMEGFRSKYARSSPGTALVLVLVPVLIGIVLMAISLGDLCLLIRWTISPMLTASGLQL